jgi:hypothetical protein
MRSQPTREKQVSRKIWKQQVRGDQSPRRKEAELSSEFSHDRQGATSSKGENLLFVLRLVAAALGLLRAGEGIWPKMARALGRVWSWH